MVKSVLGVYKSVTLNILGQAKITVFRKTFRRKIKKKINNGKNVIIFPSQFNDTFLNWMKSLVS